MAFGGRSRSKQFLPNSFPPHAGGDREAAPGSSLPNCAGIDRRWRLVPSMRRTRETMFYTVD